MALLMAAKSGDVAQFNRIVTSGARYPIDEEDNNGETPLHWAARFGNTAIVAELLKVSMDHTTDTNLAEFLKLTCFHGSINKGRVLLGNNASIHSRVEYRGADVNKKNDFGMTPLHAAAVGGQVGTLTQLLFNENCEKGTRDFFGQTALDAARKTKGNLHVCSILATWPLLQEVRELERKCAAGKDVLQKLRNDYNDEKARADKEIEELTQKSKDLDSKKAALVQELKELQSTKKQLASKYAKD